MNAGDQLRTRLGTVRILGIEKKPGVHRVYNLEIETRHCYYAGEGEVLSHNENPCAVPTSRPYDRPVNETPSGKAVKDTDVVDDWDDFLGPDQTDIDPRDGQPDPNRIWSESGERSIRYGEHEMGSTPNKHHYHKETWYKDHIDNLLQRIQRTNK